MDNPNQPAGDPGVTGGITDAATLESMSKDQLLAYAKELGAKADFSMKKADIIQVILDRGGQTESNTVPGDSIPPPGASPENQADQTDATPIGTIRIRGGVELVKVNPTDWVPVIREALPPNKPMVIISMQRAGKTIFAKTGKPITFDEQGRATVDREDGLYLQEFPDFSLPGTE
jgi:hypothetical protein